MVLPPLLEPLSWLEGSWRTENGIGQYPTIKGFSYKDEMEFTCIGQPMFRISTISRNKETNAPMHQESGFLRIKPSTNQIAFVLSHNFGLTSIEEGHFEGNTIHLKSTSINRISFAKSPKVTALERTIRLIDGNKLEMIVAMATDNTSLVEHLRAIYDKVEK